MTSNRDFAERTLGHYFRLVARSAGVQWDSDNDAEVANIVDALLQEARYEALEVLRDELSEDGIALVYAMAQNTETVKTAVAEALHREQEAERMDCPPAITLEHHAQRLDARAQIAERLRRELDAVDLYSQIEAEQAGTQEDGATMGDLQCASCLSHVTSTYAVAYRDSYLCPACASEALRSVPVSAIAYLMADIAPVDAQDVAKQHEARATVTAWLESLEEE